MKPLQLLLIVLSVECLGSSDTLCQKVHPNILCNDSILLETQKHIGKLSMIQMKNFLLTFDKSCYDKAEYCEWSNSLLFDCLKSQPSLLISVLASNRNVKMDVILEQLGTPVNDGINIDSLALVVKRVKGYTEVKKSILKELGVSIDRLH